MTRTALLAMLRRLALATGIVLSPAAAIGGEIELAKPLQAASLHDGGVDMVVFYLDRADHFEVVATYAATTAPDAPARLRMGLSDGDAVRFGLPGRPGILYGFLRDGETVRVTAEPAGRRLAAAAR